MATALTSCSGIRSIHTSFQANASLQRSSASLLSGQARNPQCQGQAFLLPVFCGDKQRGEGRQQRGPGPPCATEQATARPCASVGWPGNPPRIRLPEPPCKSATAAVSPRTSAGRLAARHRNRTDEQGRGASKDQRRSPNPCPCLLRRIHATHSGAGLTCIVTALLAATQNSCDPLWSRIDAHRRCTGGGNSKYMHVFIRSRHRRVFILVLPIRLLLLPRQQLLL